MKNKTNFQKNLEKSKTQERSHVRSSHDTSYTRFSFVQRPSW